MTMDTKTKINVNNLTDHELREELKNRDENPGPITDSTRNIYRRKLTSLLQSHDEESSDEDFVIEDEESEESEESEEEEDDESEPELEENEKEELLKDLETTTQSSGSSRIFKAFAIILVSSIALYAYKQKLPIQRMIPLISLTMILYCIYWIFGFFRRRSLSHSQEVCKMVADALELLQSPENTGSSIPVLHIRDTLISPTDRNTKKNINLWNDCVKFIEHNESRVKVAIVNVEGEDFRAWKWIGPKK